MSTSLNDPHISFSATLAATIGLEETVMLRVLSDAQQWLKSNERCCIFQPQIQQSLPFWQANDIQRIAKNLADKGLIVLHSAPYLQSSRLEFSLTHMSQTTQTPASGPAQTAPLQATRQNTTQAPSTNTYGANLIPAHWQPSADILAQLAQHRVPSEFIQQQVSDFVLYWRERGEVSHAWGSRFVKQVIRNWQMQRSQASFEAKEAQPQKVDNTWKPSNDALEILQRVDIPIDFIEDSIPEFILYWQESGKRGLAWNTKFIQHIKRQWASYTSTLQYDTEPKPITKDWQPNGDALEVLHLANIDRDFALKEIPSFVLFWSENKQAHNSWNSKFIQHAKYQWAKRHHLNIEYAHERQPNTYGSSHTKDPDFVRRHSDRSWAKDLY